MNKFWLFFLLFNGRILTILSVPESLSNVQMVMPLEISVAKIVDVPGVVRLKNGDIRALYTRACYQQSSGHLNEARETYDQITNQKLTRDQRYIYDGYVRLLFDTQQFAKLVNLFYEKKNIFTKMFQNNLPIQLMFARACLYAGKSDKAAKQFDLLEKQHKDDETVAYYKAESLLSQPEKALPYLEQCIDRAALKKQHFLFHFLSSKMYLKMQKPEQALAAINKSLACYPKFGQGLLFKAMLFEQLKVISEAIKGYENFLEVIGYDQEIENQLVQLLLSQRRFGDAAGRLRKRGKADPGHYFNIALLELKAKRLPEALESIDAALKQSPQHAKAKLLKLDILLAMNQQIQALDFIQEWLTQEPENLSVMHVLMLLKKVHISGESLIAVLEKILQIKQSALLHATLADLCMESDRHDQAKEQYQKALALAKDEPIKMKLSYMVAYSLVKLQKPDEAIKQLCEITAKTPYPAACNLLADLYARSDSNLSEALALVEKALAQKPNRPEFLDTKMSVLAKIGRDTETRVISENAVTSTPQSPIVSQNLEELNAQK